MELVGDAWRSRESTCGRFTFGMLIGIGGRRQEVSLVSGWRGCLEI